MKSFCFALFLLFCSSTLAQNDEQEFTLVSEVPGYPCTRLNSKDGPIGCSSGKGGAVGAIWGIGSDAELQEFFDSPPSFDCVLLFSRALFTKDNVEKAIKNERVKGILLGGGPKAPFFSPVSKFPQKEFGLPPSDPNYEWNPKGDEFAFQSYDIPMFALTERDSASLSTILNYAQENRAKKGEYPLWAVQMNAFMHSGKEDAATCLRRDFCDPLGGKSVWSSFYDIDTNKDIILATAAIDSNSFFHDLSIGANADMSGAVALLAAAHSLAKVENKTGFPKQILFTFFTGESWGYLGSKRFVHDIQYFHCNEVDGDRCHSPYQPSLQFQKIKLDKISSIIELNQVGKPQDKTLYVHSEHNADVESLVQQINESAIQGGYFTIARASKNTPGIPPSSLMSFLKERPSIPGVVIAEHNEHYLNNYYHSEFDDAANINIEDICATATLTARLLYALANPGAPVPQLQADCNLTASIMDCLINNYQCDLAKGYLGDALPSDPQPTQYTSVYSARSVLSFGALFIRTLMFEFTSNYRVATCSNENDACPKPAECIRGECILSSTYYHDAYSLAFNISDNWSPTDKYATESTWVESQWAAPKLTVFLIDNPTTEILAFVFGILELIASFATVWYLRRYFTKRFKTT